MKFRKFNERKTAKMMRRRTQQPRRTTHTYTHWTIKCGWCGFTAAVATDGRNLFCSHCGH